MKKAKIVFKGNMWTFLGMTFGLSVLGLITFGVGFMIIPFFQIKYMMENVEIEEVK